MKTLRSICLPAILLMVGLVFVWYQPAFADEGEQEQVVTLEQLPPAVRKTLQREGSEGTLGEVEKEIKRGRIVYEADIVLDDKEYEISIAEDGTLIGKEQEKNKKTQVQRLAHKTKKGGGMDQRATASHMGVDLY